MTTLRKINVCLKNRRPLPEISQIRAEIEEKILGLINLIQHEIKAHLNKLFGIIEIRMT